MKHKQNKHAEEILMTIFFILLIVFFIASVYLAYLIKIEYGSESFSGIVIMNNNTEKAMQKYNPEENYSTSQQFYTNMKFNKDKISYHLYDCDENQKTRMLNAMNIFSADVPQITFLEDTKGNPDIEIYCSYKETTGEENNKYFIAGEGGAKEIIFTGEYYVIKQGTILLYKFSDLQNNCDSPEIEIHELLHVFGFSHSSNPDSIMHPYLDKCNMAIDTNIIDELKRIYSENNLADLYFEGINVTKTGRYISYNISIKNKGTIGAGKFKFKIFENYNGNLKEIESREIEPIDYGAGVLINVENQRLNSASSNNLEFSLDYDNVIRELSKDNNIAQIVFKS